MTHDEAVESSRPKNCFHWQQICHCYCHRRWSFLLRPVELFLKNCWKRERNNLSPGSQRRECTVIETKRFSHEFTWCWWSMRDLYKFTIFHLPSSKMHAVNITVHLSFRSPSSVSHGNTYYKEHASCEFYASRNHHILVEKECKRTKITDTSWHTWSARHHRRSRYFLSTVGKNFLCHNCTSQVNTNK